MFCKGKSCHPNFDQWDIIVQLISFEEQTVISISNGEAFGQIRARTIQNGVLKKVFRLQSDLS
jgi:hypothetical protein